MNHDFRLSTPILALIAVVASFSLSGTAQAQDPSWSMGVGVGPNITNTDVVGDELKSSIGAALWGSRQWGEMNRFDVSLDYFKFAGSGRSYPSLNGAYGLRFFPDSRLKPFALIGLGVGQANKFPYSTDEHQVCLNLFARGGVDNILYGEKWHIGLMMDFEHVFMDGDQIESAQLALPMLTFSWKFDSEKKSSEATSIRSEPLVDSDKDGVYDNKDRCPNTPRGVKVNSIGCEPKQKVVQTLKVEFDTGKDTIRSSFMQEIDTFGQFMQENSDIKVAIEGHTDSVGSRNYNLKLSDARAKSVRKALIERWNLDPNRITAEGFGPDRPVADNDTSDGRQLNRRVDAVIQSD